MLHNLQVATLSGGRSRLLPALDELATPLLEELSAGHQHVSFLREDGAAAVPKRLEHSNNPKIFERPHAKCRLSDKSDRGVETESRRDQTRALPHSTAKESRLHSIMVRDRCSVTTAGGDCHGTAACVSQLRQTTLFAVIQVSDGYSTTTFEHHFDQRRNSPVLFDKVVPVSEGTEGGRVSDVGPGGCC